MRKIITKEDKVAKKIIDSLTDVTLDLDQVGMTIAHATSTVMFNRVQSVAEASAFERENMNDKLRTNSIRY